jgi:putative membrane protein
MIKRMSVVTSSALVLSVGAALADPSDSWGEGFGHMMWGGGFGMVGGLMMLLFVSVTSGSSCG